MKEFNLQKQNGSAIVMVLIVMLIVTGLVFLSNHSRESAIKQDSFNDTEGDLNMLSQRIANLLVAPANCNANFKGLAVPAPLTVPTPYYNITSLYRCTGTCVDAATPRALEIVPQAPGTAWNYDKGTAFTGATRRVRVSSMRWRVVTRQTAGPAGAFSPSVIELEVTFEKNISDIVKLTPTATGFATTNLRTAFELPPRVFTAYVATRRLTAPWTWTDQTAIVGCTKTPNTTTIY